MNAMRGGLGVLPLSWAETCPEPRRATHPICTGDPAPYTSPDQDDGDAPANVLRNEID